MISSPKKVLFLIRGEKTPSSQVRVLNLLPELRREGFEVEATTYPDTLNILRKLRLFRKCRQFDIVVVQRKLLSRTDTTILRKHARTLVFDFDDAIYYRSDVHAMLESKTRSARFNYLARNADLVIAANRILSEYVKQFNKNVVVIPPAVETRNIPIKDYAVSTDQTIIGWAGSASNLHHLGLLTPVFQRLASQHKIQVRIVSSSGIEIPSVDVRFVPWSLETQEAEIAAFDIGVMPLPDNKHTEGKFGYKALQYMAAAIPSVVSDVGVSREIVEDGREGFVVKTIEEFSDALRVLIENRALRKEMGINARKKVEHQYSIPVVAKKLADLLCQCGG